ncbi:MAG: ATP-binding protein [Planctomycetes bacterium]|nr:ATP-binding protein [Planctomycetota bacterium]
MKPYPLSIHTFEKLIRDGCLYVDKTAKIHRLVSGPSGAFFLSRPRRFGKSLLLSTFKAIFLGERDLFQGLAIDKLPYDWKTYPVIHLDLAPKEISKASDLREYLSNETGRLAREHGLKLETSAHDERFLELIRRLQEAKGKVVVLIDEYDKPILGNIENAGLVKEIQRILKAFYSVLKSADSYLRFVFLTGVSRFSKVSVFSDLNNLRDLSMDAAYADLLGYTEEELERHFGEAIRVFSAKSPCTYKEMLEKIRAWYNGYRFSREPTTVYNPVSIMSLLETHEFRNYWFETGTPAFLINLIKTTDYDLRRVENLRADELAFSAYDVERLSVEPLLFQTGYMTIRDYDSRRNLYTLGYPNGEVRNAFLAYLVDAYTPVRKEEATAQIVRLEDAVEAGDVDAFMKELRVFFAGIPYDLQLKHEKYYQTIFYLVFALLGIRVHAEEHTSAGRIDAVAETAKRVFVFEFKLQGTAAEALAQIRDKKYHEKYLGSGKEITLVGAAFDETTRNIGEWVAAEGK